MCTHVYAHGGHLIWAFLVAKAHRLNQQSPTCIHDTWAFPTFKKSTPVGGLEVQAPTLTLLNSGHSGLGFPPLFIRFTRPSSIFLWATLRDNSQERPLEPNPRMRRFIRRTWGLGKRVLHEGEKFSTENTSHTHTAWKLCFLEYTKGPYMIQHSSQSVTNTPTHTSPI